MRTRVLPIARTPALVSAAVLSGAAATGLWIEVLVRAWPRLTAQGVICGAEQSFLGHCAACWPAIAASVIAAGFAAAALLARQPRN